MKRLSGRKTRNASATLEFILILPLLVVILFAVAQFTVALLIRQAVTHAATVAAREAGKGEGIDEVARAVDAVLERAHGIDVAIVTVPPGIPPMPASVDAVVESGVQIALEVGQPDSEGRNATPYFFGDPEVPCIPPTEPWLQPDEVRVTVSIDLSRRPMGNWLHSFGPDYVNFSNRRFTISSLVKKE